MFRDLDFSRHGNCSCVYFKMLFSCNHVFLIYIFRNYELVCAAICIWILPTTTPWSMTMSLPQVLLFLKQHATGFLEHAFVGFVNFLGFQGPLAKFSKYGQSAKITMPARRVSTFCVRSRSQCPRCFIRADFFGNSWDERTLTRTST